MKLVKQEDPFGCAVACVASVLKIGYQEALDSFGDGKKKALERGFCCREIIDALEKEGLKYEYKYINSKVRKKIYQNRAIVFLRRSRKYPEGHYLYRMGKRWMDPWLNFPFQERQAGFRKRLPEKPIYVIYPVKTE